MAGILGLVFVDDGGEGRGMVVGILALFGERGGFRGKRSVVWERREEILDPLGPGVASYCGRGLFELEDVGWVTVAGNNWMAR